MKLLCLQFLALLVVIDFSTVKAGKVAVPCLPRTNNAGATLLKKWCNGVPNCRSKSDELTTFKNFHKNYTLVWCNNAANHHNGSCLLPRKLVCNQKVVCINTTPCDLNCSKHFRCPDGTCLPRANICDQDSCNDCPTSRQWNNGPGFKCIRSGIKCQVPQVMLFDGVKDCSDGSDLCYAGHASLADIPSDIRNSSLAKFNSTTCFKCLNSTMIISKASVCDGVIDCPDMSDECLCERAAPSICNQVLSYLSTTIPSTCRYGQLKCTDGKCVDRTKVCDGVLDCADGMDESFSYCGGTMPCAKVTVPGEKCRCDRMASATCLRRVAIYCNYRTQCLFRRNKALFSDVPEDECSPSCQWNSTAGFNQSATCAPPTFTQKSTAEFLCRNKRRRVLGKVPRNLTCNGIVDCPPKSYFNDEKRCQHRYRCQSLVGGVSIPRSQKCDGFPQCVNSRDEWKRNCKRLKRYYCNGNQLNQISISTTEVCDLVINCIDQSDEMNCTKDGRFYCENKQPLFVTRNKVFNGIGDCTDWSDECPSNRSMLAHNALSSRTELLSSPVLYAMVWIMGILAVIGNTFIFITEVRALKGFRNQSASLRSNHMLVLNLALSDLLMGLYLLALGGAEAYYTGRYCQNDLFWRSSLTCTIMGILVVLSSEASVMTMVLLTSLRLYSVCNPFTATEKPKAGIVLLLLVVVWVVAWSVALLPLSSHFHMLFTSKAWISEMPFFKSVVVEFSSFQSFAEKLMTFGPSHEDPTHLLSDIKKLTAAGSWLDFQNILSKGHNHGEQLVIYRYFNYYSADSVCLPRIFVTPADPGWGFSLSIAIFNFLAFLYVSVAYFAIYKKTVGKEKSGECKIRRSSRSGKARKQNQEIQRKIIRLIVTDFCCWVPISIMAFINFGGVKLPALAYAICAIILLPINSALNPIVYSNLIDKMLMLCKRKKGRQALSRTSVTSFT